MYDSGVARMSLLYYRVLTKALEDIEKNTQEILCKISSEQHNETCNELSNIILDDNTAMF